MSRRAYLGTKSYHPARKKNQMKVWQAEQAAQLSTQHEAERRAAFEKERRALQSETDPDADAARHSVSFLYRAPPGYFRDKEAEERADRQRKLQDPSLLTFKDKFPEIKNAPMASDVAKSMDIRVNMLGKVLRNVQCTKCHVWGHRASDRECPLKDVLLPADIERRDREDPLRTFQPTPADAQGSGSGLVLKEEIVIRGGGDAQSENQQLLAPGSDEDVAELGNDSDPEMALLRQLTPEQRSTLLKELERDRQRKRSKRHRSSTSDKRSKRKRSSSRERKPR